MVFTSNFTSARLIGDALTVSGVSVPAEGSDAIIVALLHGDELRALSVPQPQSSPWSVTFPAGGAPFLLGDQVFLTGLTKQGAPAPPLTWQQNLSILSEDAPKSVG
jgi:hypothetical protein